MSRSGPVLPPNPETLAWALPEPSDRRSEGYGGATSAPGDPPTSPLCNHPTPEEPAQPPVASSLRPPPAAGRRAASPLSSSSLFSSPASPSPPSSSAQVKPA